MVLLFDETREGMTRASLYAREALSDAASVRSIGVSALEAIDVAVAWGVLVCELGEDAFQRTIRILEDARLDWGWKVVACLGATAERLKDRLLALADPPELVLSYPSATAPIELRAIGLVVYMRARQLRHFVRRGAHDKNTIAMGESHAQSSG
ncbi:MAG: hypothetical protein HYY16_18030 [Planctomycetes bacterium]|nr:hypothetical protein [Planctomycetota bacterium]